MSGSHFLVRFTPLIIKSVAGGSGVWLCTRNPLISAAISEKSIYVNICISVHVLVFKSLYH